MTTNNIPTPDTQREPGSRCALYAALLPVLDDADILDARAAEELRAHLATCAYCQAHRQGYTRLDAALWRQFGPAQVPLLRADSMLDEF